MQIFLGVTLFLIMVMLIPFPMRIKAHYNLFGNRGAFSVKIWIFWVQISKIKFKENQWAVTVFKEDKDGKRTEKEINFTEKQMRFITFTQKEIMKKFKVKKCHIITTIGLQNPMVSALLSGTVTETVRSLFCVSKTKNPAGEYLLSSHTQFNQSVFEIAGALHFSVSVFDVLYSMITSFFKAKNNNGERKVSA